MGRKPGSKNKPKAPLGLNQLLREQEEDFVENDNHDVLSVANGHDESFETDEEVGQEDGDWRDTVEPKKSTSKAATQQTTSFQTTGPTRNSGRVKKHYALDTQAFLDKNLQNFRRGIEATQNNQFEILNGSFRVMARKIEEACGQFKKLNENMENFV